jgi:hypothetical protein
MNEDSNIDWSTTKIVWHSKVPDIADVEQQIREDCIQSLWGLDKVSELVFHHIFLGKDMEHDVVFAWGEEDNEDLHCDFMPTVSWTNLKNE